VVGGIGAPRKEDLFGVLIEALAKTEAEMRVVRMLAACLPLIQRCLGEMIEIAP
jgi:hypothetical protein